MGVIDRICAPWSLALAGYLQACFWSALVERLVSFVFELMSGLKLAWHRRRTTRRLRADFMLVHKLLSANLGRGHYSYAHFRTAPAVRTDASKQARYSGGGWVSACGAFVWFKYGSRAARLPARHRRGVRRAAGAHASSGWRTCVERLACVEGLRGASSSSTTPASRSRGPRGGLRRTAPSE